MKKWILLACLALTTLFCAVGAPTPLVPARVPSTPSPDATTDSSISMLEIAATLTAVALTSAVPASETPAADAPTETPTLSTTPMSSFPETGIISGKLSYPAEGIPALRIVAFPVDGSTPSYMDTAPNQSSYTFELPVGTYHIVAYVLPSEGFPGGFAGGYTQAIPCGLAVECADHSLIDVTVTGGETIPNIDLSDWYAPEGTFPPMPEP